MSTKTKTKKTTDNEITIDREYQGHPINTKPDKNLGCNTKILDKSLKVFNYAVDKHNKVFYMRLDVRYPQNYHPSKEGNKDFQGFMNSLTKTLRNKKLDPHYIWCRERSKEKREHYHVGLLLDGNKIQHRHRVINKAEELWSKRLNLNPDINNGLIHDCSITRDGVKQKNGTMIRRGSEDFQENFDKSFYQNSYISKTSTKGYSPKKKKEYSTSQINTKSKIKA